MAIIRLTLYRRLLLFVLLSFPLFASANDDARVLRIAVAANFVGALQQLLPEFTEQTGINTQIFSGSTGNLFQQIVHGAPYDVFLSADALRPNKLVHLGKAEYSTLKTYAIGELAFWSSHWQQKFTPTLSALLTDLTQSREKFAIANPVLAPYGKAAKQALIQMALWPHFEKQLITGSNINQTFQQLRTGAVQTGIVAYSQLKHNGLSGIKIPAKYYSPIKQNLVIVKSTQQADKAKIFTDFLLSATSQQRLSQLGYKSINSLNNKENNE